MPGLVGSGTPYMFVSVRLTALLSEVIIHFIYNALSVHYVVREHEVNRTHLKNYFLKYRVIQNDCQGFNKLSHTIHLR